MFAWDCDPEDLKRLTGLIDLLYSALIVTVLRYEYFVWQNNEGETISIMNRL